MLSAAQEDAGRMGVESAVVLLENVAPADGIVETAKTLGCDLIAMSSHGRRGVRRMLLGSVTAEVLVLSTVPVLVAR